MVTSSHCQSVRVDMQKHTKETRAAKAWERGLKRVTGKGSEISGSGMDKQMDYGW